MGILLLSLLKLIKTNNQQEELGVIDLKPVNKLMTTSEITEPSPLPRPSTNLWMNQIFM